MLATLTPTHCRPTRRVSREGALPDREMPLDPLQQVDAIRVVVAGDELLRPSAFEQVPTGVEQQVHRAPGGLMRRVRRAVLVAASGVDEMER